MAAYLNNKDGCPCWLCEERVANLWTEFAAHHVDAMATNGKKCNALSKSLVAATFEKQKLTFLPQLRFGTERSVTRQLSYETHEAAARHS